MPAKSSSPASSLSPSSLAGTAIDAYQRGLSGGLDARASYNRAVLSLPSPGQRIGAEAIKSYAAKAVDLSPIAAKSAAIREVSGASSGVSRGVSRESSGLSSGTSSASRGSGLNVREYAGAVMDSYNHARSNGSRIVYAHAAAAANDGKTDLTSAIRVADKALKQYSDLRQQGADHASARDQATRSIAQRFDERGRDTQQRERHRDRDMGL